MLRKSREDKQALNSQSNETLEARRMSLKSRFDVCNSKMTFLQKRGSLVEKAVAAWQNYRQLPPFVKNEQEFLIKFLNILQSKSFFSTHFSFSKSYTDRTTVINYLKDFIQGTYQGFSEFKTEIASCEKALGEATTYYKTMPLHDIQLAEEYSQLLEIMANFNKAKEDLYTKLEELGKVFDLLGAYDQQPQPHCRSWQQ